MPVGLCVAFCRRFSSDIVSVDALLPCCLQSLFIVNSQIALSSHKATGQQITSDLTANGLRNGLYICAISYLIN